MAQRRFLSRRITESERIAKLNDDRARFIYAALLTFTDREGRINAHPLSLKTSAFEAWEYTALDIAKALDALAEAGLIKLYGTPNHGLVGEFMNFEAFNTPHPREPPSDFAAKGPKMRAEDALMDSVRHVMGVNPQRSAGIPGNSPQGSSAFPGNGGQPCRVREEERRGVKLSGDELSSEEEEGPRDLTPPAEDAPPPSPEEAFEKTAKTGTNPTTKRNRDREHLRRLIGAQNMQNKQVKTAWTRWYDDHPRSAIEAAWKAAKDSGHKAGALYAFVDMLNGTRPLPKPQTNASTSGIGDGMNFGE